MIRQYSNEKSFGEESTFDTKKILYVVAAVVVVIGVTTGFLIFKTPAEQKDDCGNGICEAPESCRNCVKDCSCSTGEVCKNERCVKKESSVSCGNGKCEAGENENNCCDDCPCTSDKMKCNSGTHKCEASSAAEVICGNGVCDDSENCFDCPKDCKCVRGEYCSSQSRKCMKPICGNDECETSESVYNCCDDCGCSTPNCEICNKETHQCEIPEAKISDESAVAFVTDYYKTKGSVVEDIVVQGSTCTYDKPSKSVSVKLLDDDFRKLVRVTEEGEIIVLPTT